ncbi:AraC family transcriptional regulator [Paenibacillus sp. J5C_2022]|uniref:AraC family transcriptional regulator n=1 Tax=Paenibacillus sp. J5C2022 TaxID=2977129 RepID=UPI0021D262E5|nr:AraC family transcriptional regulator [Paenibacillus sp. J5C2022]MCU6709980.1 AraC family transcriptional regulator [Paenibacillus sp. J5C2022]
MAENPDPFVRTRLKESFVVKDIISLHYFEFSKDFRFEGEKHDFWEFVYVDKGEIEVFADTEGYCLQQGDVIFHKPNEFHGVWANRKVAPNVIILSFVCQSREMAFFENKIFTLDARQRELLAQMIKNGFAAFYPPFDDPRNHTLNRRPDAPIGAEQLIRLHLEMFLIHLRSSSDSATGELRLSPLTKQRSEAELVNRMCDYMESNVFGEIRLEQVYTAFNLSKSHALAIFKSHTGISIMKYYRQLKLEQAKKMIREHRHNFSEIADLLHYSSVHTFSRHFKTFVGMSPSQYARTVIARMQSNSVDGSPKTFHNQR